MMTGHGASGGFFDGKDVFGRAFAGLVQPGPNMALLDAAGAGHGRLSADEFDRAGQVPAGCVLGGGI